MKISVIIVHWNTPESLRRLATMLHQTQDLEIIVVDNASATPPTFIPETYPRVLLIQNKINRGYAFACNQGALQATGEWLVYLNPDVEVTPQEVTALVTKTKAANLVAASPEPDSKQYKKPVPTVWSLLHEFTPIGKGMPYHSSEYTLTGGCLIIQKEVLFQLGGWDERFFLWFEDSDLTRRLLDQNYPIGWISQQVVHHGGESFYSMSEQQKRDIFFHSMRVYAAKHFSAPGQQIISIITSRYTRRRVLPILDRGVFLTVPNVRSDLLERFLASYHQHTHPSITELIVVTSAVEKLGIWSLRKQFPAVHFIPISPNNGFAPTVNIGFRVSRGEWIGTYNDDTDANTRWIDEAFQNLPEHTGSFNPVIMGEDGSVESAGIVIEKRGKAAVKTTISDEKYSFTDATNGAAVIYNTEALNSVGIFDERFGSYLEDIDLSLRLSRAGFLNLVYTRGKVGHAKHATSQSLGWKKAYYDLKNWPLTIMKNWSISQIILHLPEIVVERGRNASGLLKRLRG